MQRLAQENAELQRAVKEAKEREFKLVDKDKNGVIDREEYLAAYGETPAVAKSPQQIAEEAAKWAVQQATDHAAVMTMMKEIDTNGDGMVDEAEYVKAGGTKEEFSKLLSVGDLNGDGKLDTDELEKLAADKRRNEEAQKAKEAVAKGSEKLAADKKAQPKSTDLDRAVTDRLNAEFDLADTNKNGVLTRAEFVAAVVQHEGTPPPAPKPSSRSANRPSPGNLPPHSGEFFKKFQPPRSPNSQPASQSPDKNKNNTPSGAKQATARLLPTTGQQLANKYGDRGAKAAAKAVAATVVDALAGDLPAGTTHGEATTPKGAAGGRPTSAVGGAAGKKPAQKKKVVDSALLTALRDLDDVDDLLTAPDATAAKTAPGATAAKSSAIKAVDAVMAEFGRIDLNGDGELSQAELAEAYGYGTDVDVVFQKLDTDYDGKISAAEFAAAYDVLGPLPKSTSTSPSRDPSPNRDPSTWLPATIDAIPAPTFEQVDTDQDNTISRQEFAEAYDEQATVAYFDIFDTDHNGVVSREEFAAAYEKMENDKNAKVPQPPPRQQPPQPPPRQSPVSKPAPKPSALHKLADLEFDRVDQNGDGVISREEYVAVYRDKLKNDRNNKAAAKKMMKEIDTNGDGVVDEAEFVEAGGSKQEFSKYDLNGGGKLDTDELEKLAADKRESDAVIQAANDKKHEANENILRLEKANAEMEVSTCVMRVLLNLSCEQTWAASRDSVRYALTLPELLLV